MPFLSVTRLRIRRWWFLPKFFLHAMRSLKQAKAADGVIEARTLNDANLTFWTVSLWEDEAAMRKYFTTGAHKEAMPYLRKWCDEARTANATVDQRTFPDKDFLHRLVSSGRPSKLDRPNQNHLTGLVAEPTFNV